MVTSAQGAPNVLLLSTGRADFTGLNEVRAAWPNCGVECNLRPIGGRKAAYRSTLSSGGAYLDTLDLLGLLNPTIVVVLGDRRESLAAAVAVTDWGRCKLAQLHAFEISGPNHPDSRRRWAITQLAQYAHCVPCVRPLQFSSLERTIVAGAPALAAADVAPPCFCTIDAVACFNPMPGEEKLALEVEKAAGMLSEKGLSVCRSSPGWDPGLGAFHGLTTGQCGNEGHIPAFGSGTCAGSQGRSPWLSLLKKARVMFGNSSSGLVEAPTCGTWVVNLGARQLGRAMGANVFQGPTNAEGIVRLVEELAARPMRFDGPNPYGGTSGAGVIARWLAKLAEEAYDAD